METNLKETNLNLYDMLNNIEELKKIDLKSKKHVDKSIRLVNIRVRDALYEDLCTKLSLIKLPNGEWYWKIDFISLKNLVIYISLFHDEEIRVMSEFSYFELSFDYRQIQKKLRKSSLRLE